jgi:hypothetical protein
MSLPVGWLGRFHPFGVLAMHHLEAKWVVHSEITIIKQYCHIPSLRMSAGLSSIAVSNRSGSVGLRWNGLKHGARPQSKPIFDGRAHHLR